MTAKPTPPVLPQHVRAELAVLDAPITGATAQLEQVLAVIMRTKTPAEIEAERQYDQEVAAYNAAVAAYNAPIIAERQRRQNEREAAKVQAAACSSCFCIHPADTDCY